MAEAADHIGAFNFLKDAVTSGAYVSPSSDYLRYSKLRGAVVAIEGIISAGKTTLGKNMAEFLNNLGIRAEFFQEFVEESLLNQFYRDEKKYAAGFQNFMLRSCMANLDLAECKAQHEGIVAIVDRSVWGNAVFAEMQKEKGNISGDEWSTYLRVMKNRKPCTANCVVYLDCNPAASFERMQTRGRKSESVVPLSYLRELERHYTTAMLLHMQQGTANIVPMHWDDFGTARQVLDAVLDRSYLPVGGKPVVTGDLLAAFTSDRLFRAQCVSTLIEKGSLHVE